MRITDIMADFLDSIRAYEHESGKAIHFDERESSEFVDMYFNGGGKINIEKSNADGENNQKQIMKNYRLKKWYPSLHKDWVVGDIVIPWEGQEGYYHVLNKSTTVFKGEVENNPDFWELIEEKKSLFITNDGIKVFDRNTIVYIVVSDSLVKNMRTAGYVSNHDIQYRVFFHESNADRYIWQNRRLFSYNDIKKFQSGGDGIWYDVKAIAKERSKE